MGDQARLNLAASLHSTASDLSEVASGLLRPSTDDEIEQRAKILDRIAEDASESASILRALIAGRERVHGLLARRVPRDIANVHRVPRDPGPYRPR
jgi:hypothetical protein